MRSGDQSARSRGGCMRCDRCRTFYHRGRRPWDARRRPCVGLAWAHEADAVYEVCGGTFVLKGDLETSILLKWCVSFEGNLYGTASLESPRGQIGKDTGTGGRRQAPDRRLSAACLGTPDDKAVRSSSGGRGPPMDASTSSGIIRARVLVRKLLLFHPRPWSLVQC